MYPEERQQALAVLVGQRGRVSVTAAAEQFGVTTETVRRDLAVLERAGMLRRTHGGAVPVSAVALVELGLGERTGRLAEQKGRIAAAAVDLLPGKRQHPARRRDDDRRPGRAPADRPATPRRHQRRADRRPPGERAGRDRAHARWSGARGHAVRRRRGGHQQAGRPARRRRLPRHERDHRPPRLHDTGRGRGLGQACDDRAGQRVVVLADSSKLDRETLVRFAAPADVDVLVTDDGADGTTSQPSRPPGSRSWSPDLLGPRAHPAGTRTRLAEPSGFIRSPGGPGPGDRTVLGSRAMSTTPPSARELRRAGRRSRRARPTFRRRLPVAEVEPAGLPAVRAVLPSLAARRPRRHRPHAEQRPRPPPRGRRGREQRDRARTEPTRPCVDMTVEVDDGRVTIVVQDYGAVAGRSDRAAPRTRPRHAERPGRHHRLVRRGPGRR